MQKKNPQYNRLTKKYYPLEEVAERFGISKLDLIHLGVNHDLPICVIAQDWHVELHTRRLNFPSGQILLTLSPLIAEGRDAAFQEDSKLFGYTVQPNKIEYSARHPGLIVLNGPARVAVPSLQIFESGRSSADILVELIAEAQPLPGYDYEYRFSKFHFGGKAALNEIQFVLRDADIPALESLLNASADNSASEELNASKRLATLQMQLAGIAWLVSTKDASLRDKDKPNALQIAHAVLALLDTENAKSAMNLHGMSVVNIRANIGVGMKLLRANMP